MKVYLFFSHTEVLRELPLLHVTTCYIVWSCRDHTGSPPPSTMDEHFARIAPVILLLACSLKHSDTHSHTPALTHTSFWLKTIKPTFSQQFLSPSESVPIWNKVPIFNLKASFSSFYTSTGAPWDKITYWPQL